MIADWLDYRLSDFVMISPQVYERQLILHNREMLGLQAICLVIGAIITWSVLRRPTSASRIVPFLLGLVWIWVAWSFLWQRFGELNLVAGYAAPAFAVQGIFLLAFALRRNGLAIGPVFGFAKSVAATIAAFVLLLYPLVTIISGGQWMAAEFFGLMADPTAISTLAVLALSQSRARWPLMLIPLAWCASSAATLWTLGLPQFWVVAIAPILLLLIAVLPGRKDGRAYQG